MKKYTIELNLSKRELAILRNIGCTVRDYVQSIVHYDLDKIAKPEIIDSIPYEKQIDRNLF